MVRCMFISNSYLNQLTNNLLQHIPVIAKYYTFSTVVVLMKVKEPVLFNFYQTVAVNKVETEKQIIQL